MTHYSREITMPKTKREGLENFLQIIINKLEAGETERALLATVDLQEDIRCGIYDDAMTDGATQLAFANEMQTKHLAEVAAAHQRGHEAGTAEEKSRMAAALGLLTARSSNN